MAITPGRCPPQGCPPPIEKDCIEVFKVYDQCVAEDILDNCVLADDVCTQTPIPAGSTVSCSVVPDSATCTFIGFGPFNPPFFRPVRLLQQVNVSVTVTDPNGNVICGPFNLLLSGITQAFMWAPDGTTVQCQILAVGPCSCDVVSVDDNQYICCSVKICKEIQIKALVKLLVPTYGFCEFEPCVAVPQPEFPCPPEGPFFPPQRCQEPPTFTLLNAAGIGIGGVTISLSRGATVINRVTNAAGVASFADIGGFAGGIDTISFGDPATLKLVNFPIPLEFVDTTGTARDSATACEIVFQRTAILNEYTVTIDGNQLAQVVDP